MTRDALTEIRTDRTLWKHLYQHLGASARKLPRREATREERFDHAVAHAFPTGRRGLSQAPVCFPHQEGAEEATALAAVADHIGTLPTWEPEYQAALKILPERVR